MIDRSLAVQIGAASKSTWLIIPIMVQILQMHDRTGEPQYAEGLRLIAFEANTGKQLILDLLHSGVLPNVDIADGQSNTPLIIAARENADEIHLPPSCVSQGRRSPRPRARPGKVDDWAAPRLATRATMTTASAPVAPEIMPGRPPMIAVMIPTMKAA